jgi:hypothetical protein
MNEIGFVTTLKDAKMFHIDYPETTIDKVEAGETYYIDYGKKVPKAKCLSVDEGNQVAVMKFRWGTPWKTRFIIPFSAIRTKVKGE